MPRMRWGRRELLKVISAGAAAGFLARGTSDAIAQEVKWSTGTEPPKLKAPANSCDCHHHIYDAKYPVDPRSTLRPGDAFVGDYRVLQKRIGTSRNVVVTPSTYGTDNRVTLDAVDAFGPTARAVVVVDDTVTDGELKRMHADGARGIRFNLAQAGATTPEMIEPLSKRVNELGWHIQINAPAAKIMEIMPILQRVPSPIVFDHLAHIPEPDGINHPLFGQIRALIDKGRTWVKLSGAYQDTKIGPPTYAEFDGGRAGLRQGRPRAARLGQRLAAPERAREQTRRCRAVRPICWSGRRTRRCVTVSWSRTRPFSTTIRRALDGSTLRRQGTAQYSFLSVAVVSTLCGLIGCGTTATGRSPIPDRPREREMIYVISGGWHTELGLSCGGVGRSFGRLEARLSERTLPGLRLGRARLLHGPKRGHRGPSTGGCSRAGGHARHSAPNLAGSVFRRLERVCSPRIAGRHPTSLSSFCGTIWPSKKKERRAASAPVPILKASSMPPPGRTISVIPATHGRPRRLRVAGLPVNAAGVVFAGQVLDQLPSILAGANS